MMRWRAGMVAVAVASGAWPVAARPERIVEPASAREESAADRQSWGEYKVQLQQLLATEAPGQRAASAQPRSVESCKLFQGAPERVPAQECMNCHGMHTTHPIEIDYEAARLKGQTDLRAADEVVRRGVFLPDGKVQCVTCHDAGSRWAAHIAIPPGAAVRPAVNTHDPSTYERRPALSRPEALPVGSSVSPTPLCKVCHTLGD